MGEEYRQTIEDKIEELGAEKLRVFINHDCEFRTIVNTCTVRDKANAGVPESVLKGGKSRVRG